MNAAPICTACAAIAAATTGQLLRKGRASLGPAVEDMHILEGDHQEEQLIARLKLAHPMQDRPMPESERDGAHEDA
jgi:hypothetical protein